MADDGTERALLGAMLLGDREIVEAATSEVAAEHFSREEHGHVFRASAALAESDEPINLVTLKDELMRRGVFVAVGGFPFLIAVAETASTPYTAAQARADARRIRHAAGPPTS